MKYTVVVTAHLDCNVYIRTGSRVSCTKGKIFHEMTHLYSLQVI